MKKNIFVSVLSLCILGSFLVPFDSAEASYSPDQVVSVSKKYIGVRYKTGGMSPVGFDCSGFVAYSIKKATGKSLPRTASQMFLIGKYIKKSSLEKGDLVFFSNEKKRASHTGIYVGNNKFIHSSSSKGVRIDSINGSYWKNKFIGGKRL